MNPQTYTSQYGNTRQGQQLQSLTGLLAKSENVPQQVAQPQAQAMQFAQGEQPYVKQQQQSLTQQSGIPQLQGQQADMGKIFQMYLADQSLSQKYASPQLKGTTSPIYGADLQPNSSQYTGNASSVPNPYLASPQDLVNTVTQPSGQGFQGFSSPGLNSTAMEQVPNGAANIINLLQSAIGSEQGLVGTQLGQAQGNYESTANLLSTIANAISNSYQSQQALTTAPSGYQRGSPQDASYQFDSILSQLGANASPQDVWNYLNTHQTALKLQGVNTDALWALQKDMADKGVTSTATGKVKAANTAKVPKKNTQGEWVMPNGSVLKEPFNVMGFAPLGGQKVDVAGFWNEYKQAGASDQDIVQRLLDKGYNTQ
jgi:hypothetical protein